jgi:hypothetical protein
MGAFGVKRAFKNVAGAALLALSLFWWWTVIHHAGDQVGLY